VLSYSILFIALPDILVWLFEHPLHVRFAGGASNQFFCAEPVKNLSAWLPDMSKLEAVQWPERLLRVLERCRQRSEAPLCVTEAEPANLRNVCAAKQTNS
jgi:hypothetical protein